MKKREHENKTRGNWGEQGLLLSLLPHYLRAWNRLRITKKIDKHHHIIIIIITINMKHLNAF